MRTWKHKRTICRRTSTGRFAKKAKCREYKRTRVRSCCLGKLFILPAFR